MLRIDNPTDLWEKNQQKEKSLQETNKTQKTKQNKHSKNKNKNVLTGVKLINCIYFLYKECISRIIY